MIRSTFSDLMSSEGQNALRQAERLAPTTTTYPACFDRLCKTMSKELARASLDVAMLRTKAIAKFTHADKLYYTREALEMASSEIVSDYRSARFRRFGTVADFCCGIGGDTLALTTHCHSVVAVDRDPLALAMAEANVHAMGRSATFLERDLLNDELPECDAAFLDPSRRDGQQRTLHPDDYSPALTQFLKRLPKDYPLAVKTAPGVPHSALLEYDADAEFISLNSELKECLLQFGGLRTGHRQATVLPGPHILTGEIDDPPIGELGTFIHDPDPAVTRSQLVGLLAHTLNAVAIDPGIAFLSGNAPSATPLATSYRVEAVLPMQLKKVAGYLRERGVGRVTIVKRGVDLDVNVWQRKLKLRGESHRDLLATRVDGRHTMVVAQRSLGVE